MYRSQGVGLWAGGVGGFGIWWSREIRDLVAA